MFCRNKRKLSEKTDLSCSYSLGLERGADQHILPRASAKPGSTSAKPMEQYYAYPATPRASPYLTQTSREIWPCLAVSAECSNMSAAIGCTLADSPCKQTQFCAGHNMKDTRIDSISDRNRVLRTLTYTFLYRLPRGNLAVITRVSVWITGISAPSPVPPSRGYPRCLCCLWRGVPGVCGGRPAEGSLSRAACGGCHGGAIP